jgi:hypothetical protein
MRTKAVSVVLGLAVLAGSAGCAGGGSGPGTADPSEPKFVAYHDYHDAAKQMSIPADVLVSVARFRQGRRAMCHAAPAGQLCPHPMRDWLIVQQTEDPDP